MPAPHTRALQHSWNIRSLQTLLFRWLRDFVRPGSVRVHGAARSWQMKRDNSAARGPQDLDAIDSLGREYRPSRLSWDLDEGPSAGRYLAAVNIRPVNGPIDLDDPPPMRSAIECGGAEMKRPRRRPPSTKPGPPSRPAKPRPRR